jgi:hypothetical protein
VDKGQHHEGIPLPVTEKQVGVRKRGRNGIHLMVNLEWHRLVSPEPDWFTQGTARI